MKATARLLLAWALLASCGSTHKAPSGNCQLTHVASLSHQHLPSCDDTVNTCGNPDTNPPVGGDHCPTPLACRVYSTLQPRCQWVHNLEHGHLVLAYNCPNGCPDVVQQLTDIWNAQPVDATGGRRALVTPDPLLPHRVAAIVWGYSWVGDVVDKDAIACLAAHQDEEAPEAGAACAQ